MSPAPRIYLVGAHATGKTTLARWIRDRYGLPMISEVARGVLAEMEAQVDRLRADVDLVDRYQAQVFERQIEAEEAQPGAFVSDRAFCNLAYAAHHGTLLPEVVADPRMGRYMARVREGLVFFVRPHRELLVQDGVRERLDWEEVLRIDGMVKLLLEMYAVPYVPIASLSMQERQRCVEGVLRLVDLPPAHPRVRRLSADPRRSSLVREPDGRGRRVPPVRELAEDRVAAPSRDGTGAGEPEGAPGDVLGAALDGAR